MWKYVYPVYIRWWHSNPQPLDCQPHSITTTYGKFYFKFQFEFRFNFSSLKCSTRKERETERDRERERGGGCFHLIVDLVSRVIPWAIRDKTLQKERKKERTRERRKYRDIERVINKQKEKYREETERERVVANKCLSQIIANHPFEIQKGCLSNIWK